MRTSLWHVPLPLVGRRVDLTTRGGHHLGIVLHRSGRRELVAYDDPTDPDAGRVVARLDADEAALLADLLAPRRSSAPRLHPRRRPRHRRP